MSENRAEIVRDTDGKLHLATSVTTRTDCGVVDVKLDTTVTVHSIADADLDAWCRTCFPRKEGSAD